MGVTCCPVQCCPPTKRGVSQDTWEGNCGHLEILPSTFSLTHGHSLNITWRWDMPRCSWSPKMLLGAALCDPNHHLCCPITHVMCQDPGFLLEYERVKVNDPSNSLFSETPWLILMAELCARTQLMPQIWGRGCLYEVLWLSSGSLACQNLSYWINKTLPHLVLLDRVYN